MARILVAEDEAAVRAFVTRALESAGHQVVAVADGGAAVERLMAVGGKDFDLLLTDIVMPVMDGIALALKARSLYPDLPILMMSGYPRERQRAHNLDLLLTDILAKPFQLAELLKAVDAAIDDDSTAGSQGATDQ
ncbi:MAG: response regulator [Alphaproteobacteria bacterium]|nr:MAG: response regulator [Alphaproteobacteria bacterium]